MRKITFVSLLCIFVFLFASWFTQPVLAHGNEPRLEISPGRVNPGGVIDVRGVDFEFEEVVALALIGSEVEVPLGEITADTEGIFLQIITLPADLPEGTYHFRAVTDDHEIVSPEILVQGSSVMNEAVEGQRDEGEPLLAPMPTFAPGVSLTQPAQSASPTKPASTHNQNVMTISVLVVTGIFMLFGFRRMKKQ